MWTGAGNSTRVRVQRAHPGPCGSGVTCSLPGQMPDVPVREVGEARPRGASPQERRKVARV